MCCNVNYILQKQASDGHFLGFNCLPSFYQFHDNLKFGHLVNFHMNFFQHPILKKLPKNIEFYWLQPNFQRSNKNSQEKTIKKL